ncbi:unnamed protein product [Staurois parvus]|uniref:Uncharacterized protein n=1 Tax=Staurois parvus TaxID=386267 RepID=A0ABN9AX13_9NEOB|nr:unnamed protein product [Staurois parvus]
MRSTTVLCRKKCSFYFFFLLPELTGTASTDVNYDIDNHITYSLCILDAEKSN